jgi:phosphoglycerate dehydrogenase-like enzyme
MRVSLCRKGAAKILEFLRAELPNDEILECSPDEVVDMAREVDVLLPLVARIPDAALASPRLRLVQQFGAGLDGVDVEAASRRGVYVANVPSAETANADSVAELAVLFMIALARRWPRAQENLRAGRIGAPVGTTLLGKTVVIVGFGGIGRALARRLRGFGMRIVAVSRRGSERDDRDVDAHLPTARLHDALAEADFVAVATPLNEETRGLVGREALARVKPGAFLVNVARGGVVDRDALLEALRAGKLGGAGLDVYWTEPPDPDDPLFALDVVATPHIGGATDVSLRGIAAAVAANVIRVARGEEPKNCVNARSVDRAALAAKSSRAATPTGRPSDVS